VNVGIKTFEFSKEGRIREMAVHDADAVVHVIGNSQISSGFLNSFQVAGGYLASGAN
jgi:hypothetical protein